jgi:serine protease
MPALTPSITRPRLALLIALAAGLAAATSVVVLSQAAHVAAPSPAASGRRDSAGYEPHQLLVTLKPRVSAAAAAEYVRRVSGVKATVSAHNSGDPSEALLQLPDGTQVTTVMAKLNRLAKREAKAPVRGSLPNYIARASGTPAVGKRFVPDDEGRSNVLGGWQKLQWNFDPRAGVSAPGAWGDLIADGRPGASGVTIAVIDTGVAFENWGRYRKSPDFGATKFVDPCDLVAGHIESNGSCSSTNAIDADGHGTFVAGEIAESTNNKIGLTGLAYGANIMPVRVLGDQGLGSQAAVATGIRYAVDHGAQVINLSLEFDGLGAKQIPGVISAIAYARSKNVTVVGAAGNDGRRGLDEPAADPDVISVGSTTYDLCLAQYSNWGTAMDLVAPGGNDDAAFKQKDCHPKRNLPSVFQMDISDQQSYKQFKLVSMFGTSMSTPEVSAAAAMVIASGVLGADPTPKQILDRLEATARPLDGMKPNKYYGHGLLDITSATRPGGPMKPRS